MQKVRNKFPQQSPNCNHYFEKISQSQPILNFQQNTHISDPQIALHTAEKQPL